MNGLAGRTRASLPWFVLAPLLGWVILGWTPGCGGDVGTGNAGAGGAASTGGAAGEAGTAGEAGAASLVSCEAPATCDLVACITVEAAGEHVPVCSELSPHTNPPTSGPHYPSWAEFGIYEKPIPVGFLLHSLEHSAVALLYNCALVEQKGEDCDELVDALVDFYESYPKDSLCSSGPPHRLIVAPDPNLDVPFAASAWRGHLKGECFDAERVRAFVDEHYGKNYENICYSGVDPFAAGCP